MTRKTQEIAGKKTLQKSRKPPVKIPLDFETAVGGLVAVKPEAVKRPEKKRPKKS